VLRGLCKAGSHRRFAGVAPLRLPFAETEPTMNARAATSPDRRRAADLLRRAAETLQQAAREATPAPWRRDDADVTGGALEQYRSTSKHLPAFIPFSARGRTQGAGEPMLSIPLIRARRPTPAGSLWSARCLPSPSLRCCTHWHSVWRKRSKLAAQQITSSIGQRSLSRMSSWAPPQIKIKQTEKAKICDLNTATSASYSSRFPTACPGSGLRKPRW
jgi:hypothetical protein